MILEPDWWLNIDLDDETTVDEGVDRLLELDLYQCFQFRLNKVSKQNGWVVISSFCVMLDPHQNGYWRLIDDTHDCNDWS